MVGVMGLDGTGLEGKIGKVEGQVEERKVVGLLKVGGGKLRRRREKTEVQQKCKQKFEVKQSGSRQMKSQMSPGCRSTVEGRIDSSCLNRRFFF
jgi:hypothetical protein